MPMDTHSSTDEHEADKVIVRSNGTTTYTGKDIAYQLWKLGQLGLDLNYRVFREYDDGDKVWVTIGGMKSESASGVEAPRFGGAAKVYNVIDSRQSYTQEVVRRGVAAVAPQLGEEASVHLAYEMVALSPAASEDLGLELSDEDRARPFTRGGRRGLGVKGDALLTASKPCVRETSASSRVVREEKRATAHDIAVGALRYFF